MDGQIKSTKRKLHSKEEWIELNVSKLLTLMDKGQADYQAYINFIIGLAKDFDWSVVVAFDDDCRERFKSGDLLSWDPTPLVSRFWVKNGARLVRTPTPNTGNNIGASGGGAGRTGGNNAGGNCNFFNGPRGCRKTDCRFKHKCRKCGSEAHGASECPTR